VEQFLPLLGTKASGDPPLGRDQEGTLDQHAIGRQGIEGGTIREGRHALGPQAPITLAAGIEKARAGSELPQGFF
jgi:hypothetical protein